jgi:hypothetical protein
MTKRYFLSLLLFLGLRSGSAWMAAHQGKPDFRVVVDMVQLNVAVTDSKSHYLTDLRPWDFAITEDRIPQKIATLGEGNEAPRRVSDIEQENGKPETVESSSAQVPSQPHDGSPEGSPRRDRRNQLTLRSLAPMSSSCLTPVTICIVALPLRRMLSLTSSDPWILRTG